MTLAIHKRASVVCEDFTYRAHLFEVDDFADGPSIAYLKTPNGETLRTLRNAEWKSRDGIVYFVRGDNESGDPVTWRCVGQCPRCGPVSIYATPSYDLPNWPEQ